MISINISMHLTQQQAQPQLQQYLQQKQQQQQQKQQQRQQQEARNQMNYLSHKSLPFLAQALFLSSAHEGRNKARENLILAYKSLPALAAAVVSLFVLVGSWREGSKGEDTAAMVTLPLTAKLLRTPNHFGDDYRHRLCCMVGVVKALSKSLYQSFRQIGLPRGSIGICEKLCSSKSANTSSAWTQPSRSSSSASNARRTRLSSESCFA